MVAEAGIRHIHAVEAGDERGYRDDRGPRGDLLGDDVHPVALDGEVGLQDRGDQVAQRLGPLGRAQHVIVDVLVVGDQLVVHVVEVAAHHRVQHLAHRQHDPAQQDQRLAQLEGTAVDGDVTRLVVEQVVLELLHRVVQRLDRLEVAVHDEVEQPVQQVADAVMGEVEVGVPALDDLADVQAVVLADGDQRVRQHERGDLAGGELPGGLIQPGAVGGHEQVRVVPVDLGPLPVEQRVLDGHRVQPELLLQHREVGAVRVA